jgi:hypothetical protein
MGSSISPPRSSAAIGDVDWTEEWTNWLLEADIQ